MTTMLNGIAASNGIAIAKAYRLMEPDLTVTKKAIANVDEEIVEEEEKQEEIIKEEN